jgi:hypothetical protein
MLAKIDIINLGAIYISRFKWFNQIIQKHLP